MRREFCAFFFFSFRPFLSFLSTLSHCRKKTQNVFLKKIFTGVTSPSSAPPTVVRIVKRFDDEELARVTREADERISELAERRAKRRASRRRRRGVVAAASVLAAVAALAFVLLRGRRRRLLN